MIFLYGFILLKLSVNKGFKGGRMKYLIDGKRQWKYNHTLQYVENYTAISFCSGVLNTR
jgi:hypothetical protein